MKYSNRRLAKYKDLGEIPTVLNSDGLKPDPSRDGDVCSYYFWVIIIFVFVVSLLNLIANVVIFQVSRDEMKFEPFAKLGQSFTDVSSDSKFWHQLSGTDSRKECT